jgi:hypothetical protein
LVSTVLKKAVMTKIVLTMRLMSCGDNGSKIWTNSFFFLTSTTLVQVDSQFHLSNCLSTDAVMTSPFSSCTMDLWLDYSIKFSVPCLRFFFLLVTSRRFFLSLKTAVLSKGGCWDAYSGCMLQTSCT